MPSPLTPHDRHRLETLLSALAGAGPGPQRDADRREAVELLRRAGSYDWNGVRYSVGAGGEIRQSLPWG